MPDSPEQVLRRYYQHVWAEGRVEALEDLLASNYCDHDPPPGYDGDRLAAQRFATALLSTMRDVQLTILALVATDRDAAAHWRLEWTQHGPFLGDPAADGRRITLRGADLARVDAGKITDIYHVENVLGSLRQITEERL
jgi:SnoaL-like polyketide cyclase